MNGEESMLPHGVRPYKRTPLFDETTMPAGLRHRHRTKDGVWGLIRVIEGRLRYRVLEPFSESILDPGHPGVVRPAQFHEVEPLGPVRFFVEFHRDAAAASPDEGLHEPSVDLPHD